MKPIQYEYKWNESQVVFSYKGQYKLNRFKTLPVIIEPNLCSFAGCVDLEELKMYLQIY